jgi:hypothetical protein
MAQVLTRPLLQSNGRVFWYSGIFVRGGYVLNVPYSGFGTLSRSWGAFCATPFGNLADYSGNQDHLLIFSSARDFSEHAGTSFSGRNVDS